MKRIILTLAVCCLLTVGCSKPDAEPTVVATSPISTPAVKSERELEKEQKAKASAVHAQAMKAEPMEDKPIMAVSPSLSVSPSRP